MAIRVRGNGLQIDVTVTRTGDDGEPTQVRHRESFKGTPQEAAAREKEIEAALLRGGDPTDIKQSKAAPGLTLGDALEAIYEKYWRAAAIHRTVRSSMKSAEEFFGARTAITAITTEDADRYVAHLAKQGLSASTIRSKCAVMTKLFNHYRKRGVIASAPHFELPSVGDNLRDRVITEAEERVLLSLFAQRWDVVSKRREDGTAGEDYHDLFAILMDTGARPSEVREFAVGNLRGRLLTLRKTKNGRARTVPLTARALEAFNRQAHKHGQQPFAWASNHVIRHGWDWAKTAMKLEKDDGFIPYALRHTCATRLYEKTRDLMLVMKWLGHSDIKMTLRYAKLQPGDLERACDLMEAASERRAA